MDEAADAPRGRQLWVLLPLLHRPHRVGVAHTPSAAAAAAAAGGVQGSLAELPWTVAADIEGSKVEGVWRVEGGQHKRVSGRAANKERTVSTDKHTLLQATHSYCAGMQ